MVTRGHDFDFEGSGQSRCWLLGVVDDFEGFLGVKVVTVAVGYQGSLILRFLEIIKVRTWG